MYKPIGSSFVESDKASVERAIEEIRFAFDRALSATDMYAALAAAKVVSLDIEKVIRQKFTANK